jgi:integrase
VGVIQPAGGRLKTQGTTSGESLQIAPLTARARAILDDIEADKKRGAIIRNAAKLIFTRDDGRPIGRDMISRNIKRAYKKAGIPRFTFHNYRNTALTGWVRQGIHVDIAMRAAGHTSVQMHKLYLDLKPEDIASAFQTENGKILTNKKASKKPASV